MKGTEISKEVRRRVFERDSYEGCPCCIVCGSPYALHLHHVKRRSQGGEGSADNLVTLCTVCHTKLHAGDLDIKNRSEKYLDEQNNVY